MALIKRKITATVQPNEKKNITEERSVEFEITLGETLADYVAFYGEQIIKELVEDQLIVKAQAKARPMLEKNRTAAEIQGALSVWKPGSRENVDARSALAAQLSGMTPEQQREYLAGIASEYGYNVE